jgi:hypothetical protein
MLKHSVVYYEVYRGILKETRQKGTTDSLLQEMMSHQKMNSWKN